MEGGRVKVSTKSRAKSFASKLQSSARGTDRRSSINQMERRFRLETTIGATLGVSRSENRREREKRFEKQGLKHCENRFATTPEIHRDTMQMIDR